MSTGTPSLKTIAGADVVDALATAALTGVALSGFHRAFGGWTFLVVGGVAIVVALLVGHVIDRLRLPALAALLLALVALVAVGAPASVRDRTIAGVLPKPDAFSGFVEGVVAGWRRLLTTAPPSGGLGNVLAVAFLCAFVAALGTLLLSRRSKLMGVLLVLPGLVLVLSLLFGDREPFSVVVQGAAIATLAVAWLAARRARERKMVIHSTGRKRLVSAGIMLGLMASAGLVVGRDLPLATARPRYVLRDRIDPPFDPRQFGSPLNGFQRYLVGELKDKPMFAISGLPDGGNELVRLAVLDDYDGVVWRVSPTSGSQGGRFIRAGESVPDALAGPKQEVSIKVEDLRGVWMPGVGSVSGVTWTTGGARGAATRDRFRISTVTSTGIVPLDGGWKPGDSYRLRVVMNDLTVDDVKTADRRKDQVTKIVPDVPNAITARANALTKGKVTPYDQVDAIYQFLRAGYYASGDKDKDQANAPGHSYARLIKFLETDQPIGNAEQYASAMALMVRSLDIPARVVMGFKVKAGQTEVMGADVHAWVEVGFDKGWVAFDPTSERQEKPKNQQKKPQPFYESQNVPPPPVVPPEADISARQTEQAAKNQTKKDKEQLKPTGGVDPLVVAASIGAGLPVVVLSGFATTVSLLKRRRRRRRLGAELLPNRIAGGWAEFVDVARDIGLPIGLRTTRREIALHIGTETSLRLATDADDAVFGGREPSDDIVHTYWAGVDDARRELMGVLPFFRRLRARFSLTSLRKVS